MKNLDLWDISIKDLQIRSEQKLAVCCYGSDDSNVTCDLYVCSHNLILTNFEENGNIKFHKDLSDVTSPNNSPINVTFLSISNNLCIGLANGELYTISDSGNTCELAGVCNGLLAMEWSPDQELLVLVTKNFTKILMSCTFDPINEVNLLNEEFGDKQFITVGWGKKETQFHGSEGKSFRKLQEVKAEANVLFDKIVKITWRGDGNLYAVGFTVDGIRCFKVFDREGHLQYTSEKRQGLESNLSWRPSGNIIATTQKLSDKTVVTFFEKNGLKHGGFTIPVDSTTHVEDLVWSSDSEVLAIQCKDLQENIHKILLYTTSNYHWYLKQSLSFKIDQVISKILWSNAFDIVNNKKLHIFLNNGQLYTYSWIWNIDKSSGHTDNDDAVIAVIDGSKVLLTGFRQTVIPPPMAAFEIVLVDSFINSVTFAPTKINNSSFDSNAFFVCTSDNKLIFYKQIQKFPLAYKVLKIAYLDSYDFPFQYYNWFWVDCDTIVCITVENNSYYLIKYTVNEEKLTKETFESLPEAVNRIQSHPTDSNILFLQLNNGDITQYSLKRVMEPLEISFGICCPMFNVVLIDNQLYFLGLSHKGNLFVNNIVIMNNVNSFFVHTHFLLLTSFQHVLLCTELNRAGLNAIMDHQKHESSYVYKRNIERGAKIIIVVPNDTRTIFQMPRGNLETIQPRPLSLKIIGKYLDSLKYYEAFDLMRKQRINLNLIYDHNPEKFLNNVDMFIETVSNNSWLSLFLSDLENIDVTKTMYSNSYAERKYEVSDKAFMKIQRVCDIIRENLKNRSDSSIKTLPLLTTYVKKNTTEDLENALTLIKDIKKKELSGFKFPTSSDETLKYLLYMVDVNHLFDIALGMYDFELVLLVANKSQKDPKEYIPMLNDLNDMEEYYKKFTINKYLKRYDKAVESLAKCGTEKYNELRTFVKYHSLYREALQLFSTKDDIYKQISDDFGLYLKLKKQYIEAGIIYERAGNTSKAIDCFKDALEWEMVIKLAHTLPKEQLKELYWEFILALKEQKRHKEALIILEHFLENKEDAIFYAIENSQYITALRLCSLYNRTDLRDERLLPGLLKDYKNLEELIHTNGNDFMRHRDRLFVVRENKIKNPVEMCDPSYANKDSDLYSDAGSTLASSHSRSSSRTFRSSKNKRKHERKVASLKEGSQYEDIALVMALHTLVTTTYELRLQVKEVNIALCSVDMDKEALLLQTSLDKLLKEMKNSFKDIWTNELLIEAANASIAVQNVTEGCAINIPLGIASLEPQVRIAPVIQDISWKLEGLNY